MKLSITTTALIAALPYLAVSAPLTKSSITSGENNDLATSHAAVSPSRVEAVITKRDNDEGFTDPEGLEKAPESVKIEVLSLLDELSLLKEKRSFAEDESGAAELDKRFVMALVLLVGVLHQTGVLGAVWDMFTKDVAEKGPISNLIGEGISSKIVGVPQFMTAIKNSQLMEPFLNFISSDKAPKTGFLGKVLSAVGGFFSLFRRGFKDEPLTLSRPDGSNSRGNGVHNLSKREKEHMVDLVVEKVKGAGMTEDMVEMGLETADDSPQIVAAALKNGAISIEEIYRRTKEAGLTDQILKYMSDNEGTFAEPIAEFVEEKIELRVEADHVASSTTFIASTLASVIALEPVSTSIASSQVPSSSVFVGDVKLRHIASYSNSTVTGAPLFSSEVAHAWSSTVSSTAIFADYQLPLDA